MTTHVSLRALMTAVAVTPAFCGAAFAQDATNIDTGYGEFIGTVLLGQSRRGVQTDTATPETVLSQEELDARQASTLAELLDTVPGVTLVNGATPQGSAVNLRGLGSQAGTYGSDGKVTVVIDGVAKGQEELYRTGGLLTMEPELFKEVSVTRGPAESFQFSSGAMGGTIEAVTKDAADFLEDGDRFALRQKLGYSTNTGEFLTTTILAFAPDEHLDVIAFAGYRDAGNYTDGAGNEVADTYFALPSGLLKAKYSFSEALSLTGSISYTENEETDVSYDAYQPPSFWPNVDRYTKDTTAYVAVDYNPADNALVDVTAKLTFSDEIIEQTSDATSSDIYNADHRTKRLALSVENVSLLTTGAIDHEITAGVEIGTRTRTSLTHTGVNDANAPGGTDDYVALYASDKMEFGELTLTPQLRYEAQKLTSKNNPGLADGTTYEMDALVGAVSARYALSEQVAVFGTAAYNENLPPLDDLVNSFDPTAINFSEKGVTLEAGLSYDGIDVLSTGDGLRTKLSAFSTRVWDVTTYSGVDHVNLHGVELEVSYVHPGFYADFNASRVRGTIDGGAFFNFAPADKAQLTLGKRFMDEQLDLSIEATHAWANARTTGTSGATAPSAAYTAYTLAAAFTPDSGPAEGLEFRAALENAFDVDYTPYLSAKPAMGRNLTLSIAKTF